MLVSIKFRCTDFSLLWFGGNKKEMMILLEMWHPIKNLNLTQLTSRRYLVNFYTKITP